MTDQDNKDPYWGEEGREKKAYTLLKIVEHYMATKLEQTDWLDIGCGSGGISAAIAPNVNSITGVDPESWVRWDAFMDVHKNLKFINQPVENMQVDGNCMDVVVCNQVYEHVPDPQFLIKEIYRILKPGGCCYFAGPNLLFPIEPHVFWPFVHWLPRIFAVKVLRLFGSKGILDAYSKDYWTLTRWLSKFEVINAFPYMIKNPDEIGKHGIVWKIISYIPERVLNFLTPTSPTFVFILQKPYK